MSVYGTGIYDGVDIDLYHQSQAGKLCDGVSISSSGLRTIRNECPARFYATSDLNPNKVAAKEKASLNFGRAAHSLMLGEPEFNSKFVISPYEIFNNNNAKAWRDAQTKQIVKVADMVVINDMVKALKNNRQVARAFANGAPEKSILWKHSSTGIYLKTRPDWTPEKPEKEFFVEYKTAVTIQPRALSNVVFRYGYHMQAALFIDGFRAVTGVNPFGVAHVVQEKDPPYLAELRMFTPEQIDFGRREYWRALRIFSECLTTNKWPGYTTEPEFFETPYGVQKQMEDEIDDGSEDGTEDNDGDAD